MRRALGFVAFAIALCAAPAAAQSDYMHTIARIGRVEVINRHPNCNPFVQAFDPVWFHNKGWTMPRVGWAIGYPLLNWGIVWALSKIVDRTLAAIAGPAPLEIGPHIGQTAVGLQGGRVYQLNGPDVVYDVWNRSFPTWLMLSDSSNRKRHLATWAIGDIALFCFGRP